jgi:5,10-methylenetetrahydromethanopterin reductase
VILSGIAARTSRLEVCTGVVDPTTRHPWTMAAFAATMQSCYGERFVLGLGRGDDGYFRGSGIKMASFRQMDDYTDILRALWRGEHVHYDGPVGTFEDLSFAERYHGNPPPVWFGGFCNPRGARYTAEKADGVILIPMMNPTAIAAARARIDAACEKLGRDPKTVRVGALVVTAPEMDEFEARAISGGRLVTYLQYPGYGEALCDANGWDHKVLSDIRNHPQFAGLKQVADREFQRHQLMDVAKAIPDEYVWDCSAIGTVEQCVINLQRFIDAGADEIVTYGSTPAQNAKLIRAWRDREGTAVTHG